ncbi:hypothetical protein PENSOL_c078G11446, partial [Penicillium solitum]
MLLFIHLSAPVFLHVHVLDHYYRSYHCRFHHCRFPVPVPVHLPVEVCVRILMLLAGLIDP